MNVGGPSIHVSCLTKDLTKFDYETVLLYGQLDKGEASALHLLNGQITNATLLSRMFRSFSPLNDLLSIYQVYRVIRRYKPDIVHTHASKAGLIGRTAAYLGGVKLIFHTFHGNVFDGYFGRVKTLLILLIERTLARITTKIIAISKTQKYDLVKKYRITNHDKIDVIKLGFNLSLFFDKTDNKRNLFRNEWNISTEVTVVAIIGRLAPIKNHRLFLNSASIVKKKFSKPLLFMIVGDGDQRDDLELLCKNLGLTHATMPRNVPTCDVLFTSWIKSIDRVVKAADVICLTSINEGTPVCLIESMAGGRPIVSTKVGGIEDILSENDGAIFCDGSAESFSNGILNVLNNLKEYTTLAEKASERIKEEFSSVRLIYEINELYKTHLKKYNV